MRPRSAGTSPSPGAAGAQRQRMQAKSFNTKPIRPAQKRQRDPAEAQREDHEQGDGQSIGTWGRAPSPADGHRRPWSPARRQTGETAASPARPAQAVEVPERAVVSVFHGRTLLGSMKVGSGPKLGREGLAQPLAVRGQEGADVGRSVRPSGSTSMNRRRLVEPGGFDRPRPAAPCRRCTSTLDSTSPLLVAAWSKCRPRTRRRGGVPCCCRSIGAWRAADAARLGRGRPRRALEAGR